MLAQPSWTYGGLVHDSGRWSPLRGLWRIFWFSLAPRGLTGEPAYARLRWILLMVVSAWPMGIAMNSPLAEYCLRYAMRGMGTFGILGEFVIASEVPKYFNLRDD